MKAIQIAIVVFVALEHFYFMILEMFFWDKPLGLKTFGLTPEEAKISKVLAKNQGLYNGFLVAGLFWAIISETQFKNIAAFFLCCVVIAGIYGAITSKKIKLFYIQAVPAIAGLAILFIF
ncbi:DUF1304 domain-containing protein [Lutibacter sp.]